MYKKILLLAIGVILISGLSISGFLVLQNKIGEDNWGARTSDFWETVSNKLQTINDRAVRITGDLEFMDEIKPDGLTCSNGQILKKTGADNWDCAEDTGGTADLSSSQLGQIGDVSTSTLAYGHLLMFDGTNWQDTATSSLGIGGSGTVTSVDMSVPTGLTIADNPITTSGTLALTLTEGYNIPLTASTTNWETAYSWGNHTGLYDVLGQATSTLASHTTTYDHSTFIALASLSASSPISYNNETGAFSLSTVGVASGGTGATTFTDGGILLGSGTGAITAMGVLNNGGIVVGDGTTDPQALAAFTAYDGDLRHEAGGLEADVSAYAGLISITGGATAQVNTLAGLNALLSGETVAPTTQSFYIGSTQVAINRSSATLNLAGIGTLGVGAITTSGTLALGANNITMTGSIAADGSRVTKGWFTDLDVSNAIAGSITGNAATVTGFTPASGSLTLAGADAVTITTTGATNSTLPLGTKTLVATDVATLSSLTSIGTIGTGVWQATDVGVAYGGTGVSTLTDHGVLVGSGASAITALTVGTNGQLLVGSTGADPVFATLNCADSLTCTTGAGTLEIDVDDDFIKNDGDIGTGVYDFGGATSFEIVNGASPTVDTTGEIAIDTTADQLQYYGASTKRVLSGVKTKCTVIENLAAADDNMSFGALPEAATIKSVWCNYAGTGTTVAQISLEDGAGNAMTHTTPTCTAQATVATAQSITAGGSLTARELLVFDVDNAVSPETDTYTICVSYELNSQ